MDPRCKVLLVMGKNDPNNPNPYKQQSVLIVPLPHPGVKVIRHTTVMGYDVYSTSENYLYAGRTSRTRRDRVRSCSRSKGEHGPRRRPWLRNYPRSTWSRSYSPLVQSYGSLLTISMRCIGVCERAMQLILARSVDPARKPFGKSLKDHDLFLAQLAGLRMEIESARLLVLNAADMIDRVGAKGAMRQIAMAKVLPLLPSILRRRLSCLRLQDGCWTGLSRFTALKVCVRTSYLLRPMLSLGLCVSRTVQMRFISCMSLYSIDADVVDSLAGTKSRRRRMLGRTMRR